MKVTVHPAWTLILAIEEAFDAYRGVGLSSRGYRLSVLLLWANVVGRDRACAELSALKADAGGWDGLADSLGVSSSSVHRLRRRFEAMPQVSRFAWSLDDQDAAKRFDWGDCIGSGGSGEVWRAVDALNRDVAVKFMRAVGTDGSMQALVHGLPLAAIGHHANIVAVHYAGNIRHPVSGRLSPALVMDFVAGSSLRERLADGLSAAEAKTFVRGLCAAISFIHAKRLMHGDLHSDNILCTSDGRAVLIDLVNERRRSAMSSGFIRRGWTDDVEALKATIIECLQSAKLTEAAGQFEVRSRVLTDAVAVERVAREITSTKPSERADAHMVVAFLEEWQLLERALRESSPAGTQAGAPRTLAPSIRHIAAELRGSFEATRAKRNRLMHQQELEVSQHELAELRELRRRLAAR